LSYAYFPNTIPNAPAIGGFSGSPKLSMAEFEVEDGPPIVGRRGSSHVEVYDVTFPPYTRAQLARFRDFHKTTLVEGSLPFYWNHPEDKKDYLFVFADPSEPYLVDYLFHDTFQVKTRFMKIENG